MQLVGVCDKDTSDFQIILGEVVPVGDLENLLQLRQDLETWTTGGEINASPCKDMHRDTGEHKHTHTHTHTHTHAHSHGYIHARILIHMCHMPLHALTYTNTHTNNIYIHMDLQYTHTRTHVHTHMHRWGYQVNIACTVQTQKRGEDSNTTARLSPSNKRRCGNIC